MALLCFDCCNCTIAMPTLLSSYLPCLQKLATGNKECQDPKMRCNNSRQSSRVGGVSVGMAGHPRTVNLTNKVMGLVKHFEAVAADIADICDAEGPYCNLASARVLRLDAHSQTRSNFTAISFGLRQFPLCQMQICKLSFERPCDCSRLKSRFLRCNRLPK